MPRTQRWIAEARFESFYSNTRSSKLAFDMTSKSRRAGLLLSAMLALQTAGAGRVAGAEAVTYFGDVERIFRNHCVECHRVGGNAPFALVSFEDVRRKAKTIREVVEKRIMPPWGASPQHGAFVNDPSLTAKDIAKLGRWIEGGMERGDAARALPPPPPRAEWQIGTPDVIFETEPVEVPGEGPVPYRYVRLPTNLREDRWVEATQILSTSPEIVHHVLVFIERAAPPAPGVTRPWTPPFDPTRLLEGSEPGEAWKWIAKFQDHLKDLQVGGGGGLNGSFATSLSGGRGMNFPPGRAKLLPAGATLTFQIHYTPVGTKRESKTRIGLRFAKAPPREPLDSRSLATVAFTIPPGAKSHEVKATKVLPRDALLVSLRPHMHLRGKSFRFIAEQPDGREEILLDVPKWNFEWQVEYILAKPKLLPRGTRLRAHATYDNSSGNPANPDPTKEVFFGLQSHEEMMIGYYEVVWGPDPRAASAKGAVRPAP